MSIAEKMTEIAEGQRAVYAAGYTSGQSGVIQLAEQAIQIAKGRATGYVFDTVADMNLWLEDEAHKAELVLGDNFYIRDVGVPDYWWDGETPQLLETQKVDLSEYVKNDGYIAVGKAGLICVKDYNSGTRGLIKDYDSGLDGSLCIKLANEVAIDYKGQRYQPIVPANLDYAVKSAVSTNRITMTPEEKKAACKWFGTLNVIENSDNTITVILPSGKQKTVDLSIIEIFT